MLQITVCTESTRSGRVENETMSETNTITRKLVRIRKTIGHLRIPPASFYVIACSHQTLRILERTGDTTKLHTHVLRHMAAPEQITRLVRSAIAGTDTKPLAAAYAGPRSGLFHTVASLLWFGDDVIPAVIFPEHKGRGNGHALQELVPDGPDVFRYPRPPSDAFARQRSSGPAARDHRGLSRHYFGGRHEYASKPRFPRQKDTHTLHQCNSSVRRGCPHAACPHPQAGNFEITKTKFFNVLQGINGPDIVLTSGEKNCMKHGSGIISAFWRRPGTR